MNRISNLKINKTKVLAIAYKSPRMHKYVKYRFLRWKVLAISHFNLVQVNTNEARTSEFTPPKYVESFRFSRRGKNWLFMNIDPGAILVEFGAHAGGETKVLGYSPMRTAIDQLSSG